MENNDLNESHNENKKSTSRESQEGLFSTLDYYNQNNIVNFILEKSKPWKNERKSTVYKSFAAHEINLKSIKWSATSIINIKPNWIIGVKIRPTWIYGSYYYNLENLHIKEFTLEILPHLQQILIDHNSPIPIDREKKVDEVSDDFLKMYE